MQRIETYRQLRYRTEAIILKKRFHLHCYDIWRKWLMRSLFIIQLQLCQYALTNKASNQSHDVQTIFSSIRERERCQISFFLELVLYRKADLHVIRNYPLSHNWLAPFEFALHEKSPIANGSFMNIESCDFFQQ